MPRGCKSDSSDESDSNDSRRDKSSSREHGTSRSRSNSESGSDRSRSSSRDNKRHEADRGSCDDAEDYTIPRIAPDQPLPPEVKLSPLEMVSPHLPREARPTMEVGDLGLDRWKVARDTHVKDSNPVSGAAVLGDSKRRYFAPRRVGSSLESCLSKDRRSRERLFQSFERMAHAAVIAPMSYFDAAARKRAQIEECRKSGQPIPDELRKLEFDTEAFCNDMDATIPLQGGLVNRLQYKRVENVLGGIHHTIRPETTQQALTKKDEVGADSKAYMFGHSRSTRWAEKEKNGDGRVICRRSQNNTTHEITQSQTIGDSSEGRLPAIVGSKDAVVFMDEAENIRRQRKQKATKSVVKTTDTLTQSDLPQKEVHTENLGCQRAKIRSKNRSVERCDAGNPRMGSPVASNGAKDHSSSKTRLTPEDSALVQQAIVGTSVSNDDTEASTEL